MALNDSARVCQSEAGSFEMVAAMEPLKKAEELVIVSHVKPCAVVANEENFFIGGGILTADLDPGVGLISGKLDGVGNQVCPDLTEHSEVSLNGREHLN